MGRWAVSGGHLLSSGSEARLSLPWHVVRKRQPWLGLWSGTQGPFAQGGGHHPGLVPSEHTRLSLQPWVLGGALLLEHFTPQSICHAPVGPWAGAGHSLCCHASGQLGRRWSKMPAIWGGSAFLESWVSRGQCSLSGFVAAGEGSSARKRQVLRPPTSQYLPGTC